MNTSGRQKLIKDSVHGYIYIDERYFSIIDTALFQRLKNIKQTSYISLYPSATHDRFTHSLGTYCLGKQVIEELWKNIGDSFELPFGTEKKDEITFTFEIACLLHDLGHAPFSHTGENFFKIKKMSSDMPHYEYYDTYRCEYRLDKFCYLDALLIDELCEFYNVDLDGEKNALVIKKFLKDYSKVLRGDTAKPHEKMSALIALKEMKDKILKLAACVLHTDKNEGIETGFNADLFVRCITGVTYGYSKVRDGKLSKELTFYNAIISLLNSDIIDVDKLDYILRDNFMTGYKNTGIDVERLIKSFTIVLEDGKWCRLAYKKNAFSVIENVILANDSSRRWVQNHPVILYDTYITQRCVSETFQILQEIEKADENVFEKFFSVDTLTEKGTQWFDGERIFLASDLDVIGLFKKAYMISRKNGNKEAMDIFKQYFSRDSRRHPLWKSEMEFSVCFRNRLMNETERERVRFIEDAVVAIDTFKNKTTSVREVIINESIYNQIKSEGSDFPQEGLCLINVIKSYFDEIKKDMDIVIINTTSFESRMKKLNKKSVYVEMPDYAPDSWKHHTLYSYSDLVDVDQKGENAKNTLFYMYSKHRINVKDFITYLLQEADYDNY